jgi:HNH endonuclease/AP2 domain
VTVNDKSRILAKQENLTHDRLTEVLSYDPLTGVFVWKKALNGRIKVGQIAGSINTNGHRQIRLDGYYWVSHRLAWFYVKREWPADEIDHHDLNKDNNSFRNLREATHLQNCSNRRASPLTNTSGYKGVSPLRGRWHAQIKRAGRNHSLGYFDDPKEAHEAYMEASIKLHGEFGRLS